MNRLMIPMLIAAALYANAHAQDAKQELSDVELKGKMILQQAIMADMSPGYTDDPKFDGQRQRIQRLIASAENAKPLGKKELKAAERDGTELDEDSAIWKFKNDVEKERRLLELQIRKQLIPPAPKVLTFSAPKPLQASELKEKGCMRRVAVATGLSFAERISKDVIHVYAPIKVRAHKDDTGRVVTSETRRFALHFLPDDLAARLESNRPVSFNVLIYGHDTYESASGEKTIDRMGYVDDEFVRKMIADIPKPEATKPITFSRSWASIDGKFKIEAKLDSVTNDSVVLVKPDGAKITVPLTKLSRDDSEWARAYRAATGPWTGPSL